MARKPRRRSARPTARRSSTRPPAASPQRASTALAAERRKRQEAERSLRELKKVVTTQRRRARDLVDTVLQGLYAVGLGLEASRTMVSVNPARASQALVRATDQLNDLIHRLRTYLASRTS